MRTASDGCYRDAGAGLSLAGASRLGDVGAVSGGADADQALGEGGEARIGQGLKHGYQFFGG